MADHYFEPYKRGESVIGDARGANVKSNNTAYWGVYSRS